MFLSFYCPIGSVFKSGWLDCPTEWFQPDLATEYEALRTVRHITNKALDLARTDKSIQRPQESEVAISTGSSNLRQLLDHHVVQAPSPASSTVTNLRNILMVSNAVVSTTLEGYQGYRETGEITYKGETSNVEVMVWPASWSGHFKCPRCWKYTSMVDDAICERCRIVEEQMGGQIE